MESWVSGGLQGQSGTNLVEINLKTFWKSFGISQASSIHSKKLKHAILLRRQFFIWFSSYWTLLDPIGPLKATMGLLAWGWWARLLPSSQHPHRLSYCCGCWATPGTPIGSNRPGNHKTNYFVANLAFRCRFERFYRIWDIAEGFQMVFNWLVQSLGGIDLTTHQKLMISLIFDISKY